MDSADASSPYKEENDIQWSFGKNTTVLEKLQGDYPFEISVTL